MNSEERAPVTLNNILNSFRRGKKQHTDSERRTDGAAGRYRKKRNKKNKQSRISRRSNRRR